MAAPYTCQELLAFIREHRSNEVNFSIIDQQLTAFVQQTPDGAALQEAADKYGAEYTTARAKSGSAWPEFERYVSEVERCLIALGG